MRRSRPTWATLDKKASKQTCTHAHTHAPLTVIQIGLIPDLHLSLHSFKSNVLASSLMLQQTTCWGPLPPPPSTVDYTDLTLLASLPLILVLNSSSLSL